MEPVSVLATIQKKFLEASLRFSALRGHAASLQSRKGVLSKSISLAKARIELAPQVTEAVNYLQERAHARSVGDFEELLTAFVADVIPDAGAIHLELGTERGAPALDVWLDNGGYMESVLHGNGGGMNNTVATGLVFAAHSRTQNRAFVVLDEPDCWLKANRAPALTKVIGDVANPRTLADGSYTSGCQTVMVSHHDVKLLDTRAHVLLLSVEEGVPRVATVSGESVWESDTQEGVRWLEVTNVLKHVNTRVEFSPGLNILTGEVNGGKSALVITAFRALAYGESDETMIRHGTEVMAVRVGLEHNVELEMVRNLKSSPKVVYRRYAAGVLTNEGRQEARGTVPGFISGTLRISRVDELDIQLRGQKEPIFLLNESPSRRARLLSVGRESGLLQDLVEHHRLSLRRDRDRLKQEEAELRTVNLTLRVMAPLAAMAAMTDIWTAMQQEAITSDLAVASLRALAVRLVPITERMTGLAFLMGQQPTDVQLPVLFDSSGLARIIVKLSSGTSLSRMPTVPDIPAPPTVQNTNPLQNVIARLQRAMSVVAAGAALPAAIGAPTLLDLRGLAGHVTRLTGQETALTALEKEEKLAGSATLTAEHEYTTLRARLGTCPVCQKPFG